MFPVDNTAPLHGIRVLDASRILAGPYCGQLLAELGADVIKLERPGAGDDTRSWGPPFSGALSAYFLSCNRNKRSLTLNISLPTGNELFHQLLDKSDVLIENFRTDSAEHMGLTPEALLGRHPHLIACSISGFGRTGPMRSVPGYDFAIQAMSGLMSITGPVAGPPYKVGVALTDILTGLHAAVAILACLHARKSSGHGYTVDLSLLDCAVASQVNLAQAYLSSGEVPPRLGNAHLQIVPYQLFATADGYLVLNVGNDGQWQHFCEAAQARELAADERYKTNVLRVKNRNELIPKVEALMSQHTTSQWQDRLGEKNVPHAVVLDYEQLFQHEQIAARNMKVTVRDPAGQEIDLVGSPFHISGTTLPEAKLGPVLGVHTEEVLFDVLGIKGEKVEELRKNGIV